VGAMVNRHVLDGQAYEFRNMSACRRRGRHGKACFMANCFADFSISFSKSNARIPLLRKTQQKCMAVGGGKAAGVDDASKSGCKPERGLNLSV
jgi:hypothetical protein